MKHRSSFNIHHSTLFLALLAAVITLAACEPESDSTSRNTITYVVANPTTPVTPIEADITSNQNLDALLDRFCDYAEQGQAVTFYHNGHTSGTPSKEATKFSTTSREEMKAWMRRMEDAGKQVNTAYIQTNITAFLLQLSHTTDNIKEYLVSVENMNIFNNLEA